MQRGSMQRGSMQPGTRARDPVPRPHARPPGPVCLPLILWGGSRERLERDDDLE